MTRCYFYSSIYWTQGNSGGSVNRAIMDGSNRVELFTGLNNPRGIHIDLQESRLYWTVAGDAKIDSSNLDGEDRRTVVQLWPQGIAVLDGYIFWSDNYAGKLQRSSKSGSDVSTLLDASVDMKHITVLFDPNLPIGRVNHCEDKSCSTVCVLTTSSYRCLG